MEFEHWAFLFGAVQVCSVGAEQMPLQSLLLWVSFQLLMLPLFQLRDLNPRLCSLLEVIRRSVDHWADDFVASFVQLQNSICIRT